MDNYRWAAEEKIIAPDPALPVPGSRTDHNPAIGIGSVMVQGFTKLSDRISRHKGSSFFLTSLSDLPGRFRKDDKNDKDEKTVDFKYT